MEIPPSSSFAQSTAFFSGLSRDDVTQSILSIGPEPARNSLLYSNNVNVASSMTGELQDFKYDNYREAYRMMNGPPKYPFQNIAQISNYKFDPYYFDGSENDPNFNVNENLIGTPLGTSILEDPRLSYVKNIMTMKEYHGRADQLNDAYIKELYMVNSEKGSNYYINMLERQQEALEYWTREGRASKNKTIPGIAFTYNLPAGETQRPLKKMKLNQTIYSETPSVQRNYRREVMNRLPNDPMKTYDGYVLQSDTDAGLITLGKNVIPNPLTPVYFTGSIGNGINMTPVNITPSNTPPQTPKQGKGKVSTPIINPAPQPNLNPTNNIPPNTNSASTPLKSLSPLQKVSTPFANRQMFSSLHKLYQDALNAYSAVDPVSATSYDRRVSMTMRDPSKNVLRDPTTKIYRSNISKASNAKLQQQVIDRGTDLIDFMDSRFPTKEGRKVLLNSITLLP